MTNTLKELLKNSPVTQYYSEHPNRGWEPKSPCDACGNLVELGWRISLGIPSDCGLVQSPVERLLLLESVYWEAVAKGLLSEIRVFNLVQTVCERLKLATTDELKLETTKGVLCRIAKVTI